MKSIKNKLLNALIIFGGVITILLFSLIFSTRLETVFMLKPNLTEISRDALEVHYVDVGQGDSILIKFDDGTTMIVDSGSESKEKQLLNYIENVFFRNNKNKTFDYALLTHSDFDHSGNFVRIIEKFGVKIFYRPKIFVEGLESSFINEKALYDNSETYGRLISKLYELENKSQIDVKFIEMDSFIEFNNKAYVHMLSPVKNYYPETNNYSPIMVFEHNNVKFMLTGDSDITNENEVILNYDSEILDVDVLKLGHHGSDTSTSPNFLLATSPKYAIISVGSNNSYNHPSKDTINNIINYNQHNGEENDIEIMQTQHLGNIICYVESENDAKFVNVKNVDDYLFIDWYVIILSLILITAIIEFTPIFIMWLKKGNIKQL